MRLFFRSSRGLIGRGHLRRGPRSAVTILLETLPPVFHVGLTLALSYYAVALHPDEPAWLVAALFIDGQIFAQWLFFRLNQSTVEPSSKNFPGYIHRYPSLAHAREDDDFDRAPLLDNRLALESMRREWKECELCDMHVPARSHHCGHCGRCICYFLGACVGGANLRHFTAFCFWACLGCLVGVANLTNVMLYYRDPFDGEWPFYVLPYSFVQYLVGRAVFFEVAYCALINFGLGAVAATVFMLFTSLRSALTGRTPYEERNRAMVARRDEYGREDRASLVLWEDEPARGPQPGPSRHFRQSFGHYGALVFLCPWSPFGGEPEAPLGYKRIITYSSDYVSNGLVHTMNGQELEENF